MEVLCFYMYAKDEKTLDIRGKSFPALAAAKIEFENLFGVTNIHLYMNAAKEFALDMPDNFWMGKELQDKVLKELSQRLLTTRTKYSAKGSFNTSIEPLD